MQETPSDSTYRKQRCDLQVVIMIASTFDNDSSELTEFAISVMFPLAMTS